MFEKIVLRRSESGPPLTPGELAEALLFYQNVHIVLDFASLNNLIAAISMPTLLAVLSRKNVSAVYCEETLGIQTVDLGGIKTHSFVAFFYSGDKEVGVLKSRKKRLEYMLIKKGYDKKVAMRYVERFRSLVPIRKLTSDYFVTGGVINAAWDDILDNNFVHEAARCSLIKLVGSNNVPKEFQYEIYGHKQNFTIVTDIRFDDLNDWIKACTPEASELTPSRLSEHLLSARADVMLAAHYGGEFYTSDLNSEIVKLRFAELLKRIGLEKAELEVFKEMIIPEGRSVREVVNADERSFGDFLILLDKSQKFRDWVSGVNPDEKLVRAYMQDVTSKGWINKLPTKTLRYILGDLVGLVEPIAGAAISAADSFLLEKILGGWRPNHFVEKKLRPFVDEE